MKKIILIASVVGLISTASIAQNATSRLDDRQHAQRVRIQDGRRDGDITRREAAALNIEQRRIRIAERRVAADGDVTRVERRKLDRRQDRTSRRIYHARHRADVGAS